MKKTLLLIAIVTVLLSTSVAFGQVTANDTATLSVTVGNEATIVVDSSSKTTTFSTSTAFADYTATTNYHFQVRTSSGSGGGGFIEVAITSDFSPTTGGPSAYAPAAGDSLKITASTASAGTSVVPANQVNATAQNVVTFGPNVHAGSPGAVSTNGATGSVSWDLTNDPNYQTGTYKATATFTISAS